MKKLCQKCGLEISAQNYSRHIAKCDGSGLRTFVKAPKLDTYICQYCSKECKNLNSLKQHEVRCSRNPERHGHNHLVEHIAQRKGTTKETNEIIAKQVSTARARRDAGLYASIPFHNIKNESEYLYLEHNKREIQKWLSYISDVHVQIPAEANLHINSEGYVAIANLKSQRKSSNNMIISFEHEYVANVLLNCALESKNTIHHINRIRSDNRTENLMVFIDRANHLRYHTSKYAYLIFDSETKLFSCEIRK